jgi:hypothetical protein
MNAKITLAALLCFALIGCSSESEELIPNIEANEIIIIDGGTTGNSTVCEYSTNLIAGQNIVIGTLDVTYDEANLLMTVTYNTINGWEIDATHLWVGNCESRPANNPGNPLIGHFPYAESHPDGTTSYTYTFDIFEEGITCDGCIAAHAEADGPNGQNETAWAEGDPYGGSSWAMFFGYDFCTCN